MFYFLDLKCTRIKFLRFGEEGAEGRRCFSYTVIKKKSPQTQQENQKKLSNILFKMKTNHLQTRMTLRCAYSFFPL